MDRGMALDFLIDKLGVTKKFMKKPKGLGLSKRKRTSNDSTYTRRCS